MRRAIYKRAITISTLVVFTYSVQETDSLAQNGPSINQSLLVTPVYKNQSPKIKQRRFMGSLITTLKKKLSDVYGPKATSAVRRQLKIKSGSEFSRAQLTLMGNIIEVDWVIQAKFVKTYNGLHLRALLANLQANEFTVYAQNIPSNIQESELGRLLGEYIIEQISKTVTESHTKYQCT